MGTLTLLDHHRSVMISACQELYYHHLAFCCTHFPSTLPPSSTSIPVSHFLHFPERLSKDTQKTGASLLHCSCGLYLLAVRVIVIAEQEIFQLREARVAPLIQDCIVLWPVEETDISATTAMHFSLYNYWKMVSLERSVFSLNQKDLHQKPDIYQSWLSALLFNSIAAVLEKSGCDISRHRHLASYPQD